MICNWLPRSWLAVARLSACMAIGCGRGGAEPDSDEALLIYGDSILTFKDVERRIPVGLSTEDSAALFKKIVASWAESMVLTDMARSKLNDFDEIERKVNDYRNRLIVMSYLSMMQSKSGNTADEAEVRKFYEANHTSMLSERPLIKGILLKVPESVKGLDEIKRCVFTASDESLDELERTWAAEAIQYDYFNHTWVDFQVVAEQIPYRFFDPDAFVSSTRNFETTNGGTVYLLHISESLPSGTELPYEFASPRIAAMLEKAKVSKYENDLVRSLIRNSISEDRLKVVGYDPIRGQLLEKRKLKEEKDSKRDDK